LLLKTGEVTGKARLRILRVDQEHPAIPFTQFLGRLGHLNKESAPVVLEGRHYPGIAVGRRLLGGSPTDELVDKGLTDARTAGDLTLREARAFRAEPDDEVPQHHSEQRRIA